METKAWEGFIEIPTYCLGEEDPFPPFQRQGDDAIYPYTMLDDITDHKITHKYHAAFLENEYILLTILPEVGGRIYSAYDKLAGREIFYRNNVVKPALIALRGAWLSGGVEFNFPKGHSTTTVSPILHTVRKYPDGSASVIVGNRERLSGMKWWVEIKLYPKRAYIETIISLYNPTSFPHRFYFWSNAAVPANEHMQFIYPVSSAYYGSTTVHYPIHEGIDLSWYINHKFAVDLFARNSKDDFFCAYDHSADFGTVHFASRFDAVGKKFFTWGSADDGLIWAEILSDEDGPYCEIQSGRFKDQSTYDFLLPHFRESWRELWYPIRGIQGLVRANELVAVNLKRQSGNILVGVYATTHIPSAKIILEKDGRPIHEIETLLSPEKPLFTQLPNLPRSIAPLTLRVLAENMELISYREDLEMEELREVRLEEKDTAETLYLKGLEKERFNRKKEAENLYSKSLQMDDGFTLSRIALGRLYLEKGLWRECELNLLRALARNPHSGPAHFYLGLLYKLTDRTKEAREHLWKVRDGELLPLSLFHLGEIAMREKNYAQAEELLRRALEKRWDDILTRDLLAVALRKQGKKSSAIDTLEQSLQLDPLDFFALFELFLLDGRKDFQKMLSRDKGLPVLLPNGEIGFTSDPYVFTAEDYLSIARVYISAGLVEEAMSLLEEYLNDRESVYPLIHYYLGYIWDKLGNEEKAKCYFGLASKGDPDFVFPNELESLEVLNTALRYNPQDAFAMLYLGNLLFALGRENEAVKTWEKAMEHLKHPVLYRNLALGYKMVLGNYEKARRLYEMALELEQNWRLYLEYDRLLAERKETEKRLELLLSTPKKVREKFQIAARLAEVYLELGEYDKTIEILMSHTFRPWEGEVRMRQIYYRAFLGRGRMLYEKGDYEGALESFQKALEYPRNIGVGKPYNAQDEEAQKWLERTMEKLKEMK